MGLAPLPTFCYYQPHWPATANQWLPPNDATSTASAFAAGITFVDAVHPLNNSQEEQIIRVDGNAAHRFEVRQGVSFTLAGAPSSRRWGINRRVIARFLSTSSAPTAQAFWFGNTQDGAADANVFAVFINTDKTITLKCYDNSSTLVNTFTSTATIQYDDAWRQYEVWGVLSDAAGAALTNARWSVRAIENLTSTRTEASFIAPIAGADDFPTRSMNGGFWLGETTARGAGFAWDMCNLYGAVEDADDPWGLIRQDVMYPSGSGHLTEFSGGIDYTNVDEMADATLANRVPDNGTTFDVHVVAGGLPDYNLYTQTDPAYCTGSDSPIGCVYGLDCNGTAIGEKGQTIDWRMIYSDGTNDIKSAISGVDTTYRYFCKIALVAADATAWSFADLQNMQIGAGIEASSISPTFRISTLQTIVAYQASGETTPDVGDVATRRIFVT